MHPLIPQTEGERPTHCDFFPLLPVSDYFLIPNFSNTPLSLGFDASFAPVEAKIAEREAQTAS
jgi:hypothetical protein